MTCPKLYGSNQMNSVKINNKNNLSKKLRKQQTWATKKKWKVNQEYIWIFLTGKKNNHLSGNKWDMTYLVCSLDSTVPSPPGLGWPLDMAGRMAHSTWPEPAGIHRPCKGLLPTSPRPVGDSGDSDRVQRFKRETPEAEQQASTGASKGTPSAPALLTMPLDKKAFNKHGASPLLSIGFF